MCEINPKRARYFRLEVFTAHEMSTEDWTNEVYVRILGCEQEMNKSGIVRAHIHELSEDQKETFQIMLNALERHGACRAIYHDLAQDLFNDRMEN